MEQHEVPDMQMIIIKRGQPQEDHPHGGAWKVAFADFMTAMFAFFLVLWIVNSTNKETRASVARYFNPIRISDTTAARKGLKDPKEADFDASAADENKVPAKATTTGAGSEGQVGNAGGNGGHVVAESAKGSASAGPLDPITAQDPFIVLDEIAGQKTGASSADGRAASAEFDLLYDGPTQYRDPFAPPAPVVPPQAKPALRVVPTPPSATPAATASNPRASKAAAEAAAAERSALDAQAVAERLNAGAEGAGARDLKDAKDIKDVKEAKEGKEGKAAAQQNASQQNLAQQTVTEAAQLRESISRVLNDAGLAQGPKLDVRVVDDGILVSLTDDFNFSMFAVGSAEPQPKVVRAMERIGQLLSAQQGMFVVRGHTDARAYKSRAYDNWRLSSARAQIAAYMLMRGKLDERRIERIEGHADRALRNTTDPLAAENRRIEILLRRTK